MNSAIDSSACLNCKLISNDCKLLKCCHSLCEVCFYNFQSNDALHCPNCQIHTQVSELQDNFILSEILTALQFEKKFQQNKKCSNCTSFFPTKATHYCIECKKFYCQHDYTQHQDLITPPYYHHVIKSSGGPSTMRPNTCTTCRHSNKASFFCLSEDLAICRYCARKDHSSHDCVSISQVHKGKVDEINAQLQTILNKVNSINEYVKSLETMSLDLERYEKRTVSEIIEYYDNEVRNIHERQRLELNDFFIEVESRRTSISNTIHQAKQLKSLLRQTHKYIKSSTIVLSPPTFISNVPFLNTRCEEIIDKTQDFNFNFRTVIQPFDHDFYRNPCREESFAGSMISLDSSIVNARAWYNSSQSTRNNSQTNQQYLAASQRNYIQTNQSRAHTLL